MSPEVIIVRRRGRRWWRRARRLVGVLAWLLTLGLVYLALPAPFGAKLGLTVVSGNSMLPTYETGDAVVTWRTGDYEVGEPIVYAVPDGEVGAGVFVVHRVVDIEGDAYVTRGDNNDGDDKWRPTDRNVQGAVVARVPYGAFLLRWVTSPLSMAAACGMFTMFAVLTSGRGGGRRRGPPGGSGGLPGRRRAVPHRPVRQHVLTSRTGAVAIAGVVALVVAPVGTAATLGGLLADDLYSTARAAALSGNPVEVVQVIDSDDPGEYCATVTVTNTSTESVTWGTTVDVAAQGGTSIASSSGVVTVSFTPTAWKVKGEPGNAVLAPGASTEFEYCAARGVPGLTPGTFSLVVEAQASQYCVTATVSSTSAEWVRWSATITRATPGLSAPAYWLAAPPTSSWGATTVDFDPSTGAWLVRGPDDDNGFVRAGSSRTFGWCAPYNGSATPGQTTSSMAVSFGQQQYCVQVTVTTTAADWVRWQTTISHTTPGLTSQAYWLAAAPSPSNAQTASFDATTGTWVVEGIAGNNAVVKAGSPATWSYCAPTAAPDVAAATATATVTSFGGTTYCADVTVSTTATDWVRWQATIDHTTPGLTATPYRLAAAGSPSNASTVSFNAGVWVLRGVSHNAYITAGSPQTWSFCAPLSQAVLTEATSAVTVTSTGNGQFCANVTVSTASSDWIAWKSTISRTTPGVSAAGYWLTAVPTTLTNVASHDFAAPTGTWVAKGVTHNAYIKAGSPVTWTYCAPLQTGGSALVDATVSAVVDNAWNTNSYCATVTVTTTSPTLVPWRAKIDHSTPGLTATNRWLTAQPTNLWNAQSQSFHAPTGVWVLVGASHNATVSASSPTTFGFCTPY
ncbi:signal peptidase I [Nocardioides sp. cx-173]|uniref:signal peptidase I n=1 Tax=Nocardioides sp. cx-173 TaxID=2898796 RepID=UPI001E29FC03|nr:signal peptidase I [Nocardioides sp. cx-173]MCD4524507.1 signal peptidase I [Nocardioides sp. cx-173]UGB43008.1 signal peptidase I [Nocardioides sp. cx-173]